MQHWPDYVARVTSDEGEIGKGHLSKFQDIETTTPVILTTSQLLTTGVDAPTCKNIVLARMVGSITEFKQILGRGTRLREEYGKLSFNVLDFTGSATRHFADAEFDGDPITESVVVIDVEGHELETETVVDNEDETDDETKGRTAREKDGETPEYDPDNPRKFYFDGGSVSIAAHQVMELDPDGHVLRVVKFTDYAAEKVRSITGTPEALRAAWTDPAAREALLERLAERGLTPETIAEQTGAPEADAFDLLCGLAFGTPVLTRRERATRVGKEQAAFFARYGPEAREILGELVEKYAAHGIGQLRLPDVLKLPPISDHGNPTEIAARFGGVAELKAALTRLQTMIYEEAA